MIFGEAEGHEKACKKAGDMKQGSRDPEEKQRTANADQGFLCSGSSPVRTCVLTGQRLSSQDIVGKAGRCGGV